MPLPEPDSSSRTRRSQRFEPGSTATPKGSNSHSAWLSRQVQAMAAAWARGEPVSAGELLAGHPELGDEAAIRLIYEEVCLRREAGQEIATTEIVTRFPRWKDELEVLLGCDRMLRPFSRVALFPEPGENLGPFRLLAELGRGASGKTYLAAEPSLSNRLVVLKVITDDQEEHLSLARLRHTHIIPLFSEQSWPERGLRALCMPYLGGASLTRILEGVAHIPPAERRGRDLLDVLGRVRRVEADPSIADSPFRRYLEQASYVQAVCWIVACLADALHAAHAHGLLHMDVKPSNVLIAADGLPVLLDFHLAHRPMAAGERIGDRLGGTPGWMAPEHRAAMDAVGRGQVLSEAVDGRADLYGLGLLLRYALAGPEARGRGDNRSWHTQNSRVTTGLADIVDKCTAENAPGRYGDAGALADDLRRYLSEQPLRGVANRSVLETWRKWRRRRPAALSPWIAGFISCAAVLAILVFAYAFHNERVREIETALIDGQKLRSEGRLPEALRTLGRGLERARAVPGVPDLTNTLKQQIRLAQRGQRAAALHELADLIRFRHGINLPSDAEARALITSIRAVWNERDLLLGSNTGALDPRSEQLIRADLLELAIASAELRLSLATGVEVDAARRDVQELLDHATAWCGPSPRLERLRQAKTGTPAPAPIPSAGGQVLAAVFVMDHYDQGRDYLRAGQFREAAREFQRVLDDRPQDFWPNFYQGQCAYRMGQFHDALAAFRTCVALAPDSAECYFNRARVAEALARRDAAMRDYTRALELDPALTSASINRGILAYQNGRIDDAITDFHRALRASTDSRTTGLVHFNLALAHLAHGDRTAALENAQAAIAHGHVEASALADQLGQKH
jgi:eukaryotic-like serine/threonine-protein kinase